MKKTAKPIEQISPVIQKTLNSSPVNPDHQCISDLETFGNPDAWKLLCKASSKAEGWMKSTKAMDIGAGTLVQVSTQQGDQIAEALQYLPAVGVRPSKYGGYRLVGHLQYKEPEL